MKNIGDKILDFIKDYWYIVVAVICFIFIQKRSFVFINTDKKIKVELYDMCQDSLDNEEVLDGLNYEPKEIKYLAWHCAATKEGRDYTASEIAGWWKMRGWKSPGYHMIIHLNGKIDTLVKLDKDKYISYKERVNGVLGFNSVTISIAYLGGVDRYGFSKDTRTIPQKQSMYRLERFIKGKFPLITVRKHRDFPNVNKDCPSF